MATIVISVVAVKAAVILYALFVPGRTPDNSRYARQSS